MSQVRTQKVPFATNRLSILAILKWLQKNLVFSVPLSMALGIIVGYYSNVSGLKQLIVPATFLMVYPIMVSLNVSKLLSKGDLRLLIVTQLINFLLIPAAAYLIGWLFFIDNLSLRIGLLLIGLIPTSGMTITWTGIAKGNMHGAIRITVSGLLLGALLTPFYLKVLLGESIDIALGRIILQIAVVVFIPLILGIITQRILISKNGKEAFQNGIKQKFPPFSTFGVLLIVFIAMALKSKAILGQPEMIIKILIPLLVFYILVFLISTIKARGFFNKADGIALVYGSAMRNLSIALAVAMSVFRESGADIALVIALAFIVQVQMAVWYVKLTPRIFSK